MDDLIQDVTSVMMQILMNFAPDYVANFEFQLTGYIFSCVFFLITIAFIYSVIASLTKTVSAWFGRR